jgi:hypothetical protein
LAPAVDSRAAVCADPHAALSVSMQRANIAVGKAVQRAELLYATTRDSVQAKTGSNPYVVIHSLYDPSREIAGDLKSRVCGIERCMPIAIQPVDPVACGSKPNGTIACIKYV